MSKATSNARRRRSRGTAAVAAILVLIIAQLTVTISVLGVAREQDTMLDRVDGVRAFYAADAAMNMSIRELINSADEDGDGSIGGISDNSNAANDPSLTGGVTFYSTYSGGSTGLLTSYGSIRSVVHSVQSTVK